MAKSKSDKSKSERSASSRKNPSGSRSSRRIKKSQAATKQVKGKKPVKKEQVEEIEDADEEIVRDPQPTASGAANNFVNHGGNDSDASQRPGEAPPGWAYQLVPATQFSETAGEVAQRIYGDDLNTDSALSKRLCEEIALRPVRQRRPETALNMERRSNVEAFLAHLTGVPVERSCKNCAKGHGPWHECIIYDGQMCGSCTNCWFNASGSRCTFHEFYLRSGSYSYAVCGNAYPTHAYACSTTNLINEALALGVSGTSLDRLISRVESAAIELGNRMGEFQDFIRTPEGQALMAQRTELLTPTGTTSEGTAEETAFVGGEEN
ncbi:hypothetical protein FLONG3_10029 [Fusarium longipes]|uniref:Uncharacterized protein n=1 Tax=Fusarium longipes TaxID=694270 RepID=A0A395RSF9_9HYPO|nr:hypothetical protein FLONG3_10029 [Fusarium longipes]